MVNNRKSSETWMRRKAKQGFRGYPVATVAFYGPTADIGTKVAVSITFKEGHEVDLLERWFSQENDVRKDLAVAEKISAFLKENGAKTLIVTDGLIGCPHEEGIDYPEGKSCPMCPYWSGRDRFPRERIH
jgi:phosphoserine phosphatase